MEVMNMSNKKYESSTKRYIYNWEQAQFFIQEGCKVIEIGKHKKTNNTYFVFYNGDIQEAFKKWNKRNN